MSAIIVTTIDDEEYVGYDWEDMEDMEARGGVGCVHSRIAIDDRLNERYRIVYKLGYGTWSCVWLAIDEETRKYVAIKVGIAQSDGSEGEVLAEISQSLASSNVSNDKKLLVPTLLDRFEISGPKGTHPCLIVHEKGYAHGDLHLNNLLLQLPSSLDDMSVEKLYETYGKPLIYPVRLSVPGHDINLAEAKLMLSDFGTAFRPADNM
ncbi:related to dis1-suppressing protein kinase dsk1 [Claviceps purpurea 20.1]|uniref:non-specific serine/threonine protein kinase n=1 Tax=Claviceps purpurea (strain 20.1) TaxID=1111077 RepID=M1WD18_CLAP2|nr:related to dis1-suppressing protein kinase dsk1 [Claviceps purpurea 20.1]